MKPTIPFSALIDASIKWSEQHRTITLAKFSEGIDVQKWMLNQIENNISDNDYVHRSMFETLQGIREQIDESVKMRERTLALFN